MILIEKDFLHKITFISTVHKENGKCSPEELYSILKEIKPDIIFLEAVENTYTEYQKYVFKNFEVYHNKLEVAAIQKYDAEASFIYVPVCENGLTIEFEKKAEIVSKDIQLQKLIDNYNFLAASYGFDFINSAESLSLHEEMRVLESQILNNFEIDNTVNAGIDAYENSMIANIYSYCNNNEFDTGVFMCGVAHRKAIIKKIEKSKLIEELSLNWIVFGD